jgi:tripartite-type tricarboxylate transporter receptor subunit TctC
MGWRCVRRSIVGLLVGVTLSLAATSAAAQYPTKPVRVVVPFGAGSTTDTIMRIIAQPLGQALGQPIIIDNKPVPTA